MSLRNALAALACAGVLAACASTRPPPAALPVLDAAARLEAEAAQEARAAALVAVPAWGLEGRASITRGSDGGSGRIEWRQEGARFTVSLAAPVTRQSWRLSSGDDGARLEGLEGGPRTGPDPEALLYDATGLVVPVDALGAWLRGLPADPSLHGPSQLHFGSDLMPLRLEQAGWTIEYRRWQAPEAGAPALPLRIDARRGDAGVRLVVDQWSGSAR